MAQVISDEDNLQEKNVDGKPDSPGSASPPPQQPREREHRKRGRMSSSQSPRPYGDRRGRGPHSPPPRRAPPYKRRKGGVRGGSSSSRGGYGDRRGRGTHSPPSRRRSSPSPPYKRSKGDDGRRSSSSRRGYGDRRVRGSRRTGDDGGGSSSWRRGYGRGERRWFGHLVNPHSPPPRRSRRRGGSSSSRRGYTRALTRKSRSTPPYKRRGGSSSSRGGQYGRYQDNHTDSATQKRTYFNAHKHEEWLKNKYHPSNLREIIEKRNNAARKLANDFQLHMWTDSLDLGPAADVSKKPKRAPGEGGADASELAAAPKAHPVCSAPTRLRADLDQALALLHKLDAEKSIIHNILRQSEGSPSGPVVTVSFFKTSKRLEGVELLDTVLTYLWRIHGVDYYGMVETTKGKGFRHVRAKVKGPGSVCSDAEWERRLDSCWQERLKKADPLEVMASTEKIDGANAKALDTYVRKVATGKHGLTYGCKAEDCKMLFFAVKLVHNHLKLKHSEIVDELTSKVLEELYFENYMNDEDAPGGRRPAMQQQKQRRRPSSSRELSRRRPRRRRHDRDFDSSSGRGIPPRPRPPPPTTVQMPAPPTNVVMSAPPTAPTNVVMSAPPPAPTTWVMPAPPPAPTTWVMPAPVAGPMGPFAPEYAHQALLQQGGPSQFLGGGSGPFLFLGGLGGPFPLQGGLPFPIQGGVGLYPGGHSSFETGSGSRSRSRLRIGGPSPTLALPPQDPRPLRSYADLVDVPDDDDDI